MWEEDEVTSRLFLVGKRGVWGAAWGQYSTYLTKPTKHHLLSSAHREQRREANIPLGCVYPALLDAPIPDPISVCSKQDESSALVPRQVLSHAEQHRTA